MADFFEVVDWTPAVLPCAPRPINGELLSSWARRLASSNVITLTEICACIRDLQGGRERASIYDYGAPKPVGRSPEWRGFGVMPR